MIGRRRGALLRAVSIVPAIGLRARGITPVIPGKRGRKRKIRHEQRRYRERWRIEATFCRLKDFRRIATRYDKLARNYASALALAAVIAFWC